MYIPTTIQYNNYYSINIDSEIEMYLPTNCILRYTNQYYNIQSLNHIIIVFE